MPGTFDYLLEKVAQAAFAQAPFEHVETSGCKALTWMLNINPGADAEQADYHTHYLRFKDQWRFIGEFWKTNLQFDRDWLPWDWCETVKRQRTNNSIVLFSPSNDTIHAVKANYDHLRTQPTQFYGNLWDEKQDLPKVGFRHFDFAAQLPQESWGRAQLRRVKNLPVVQRLKSSRVGETVRAVKHNVQRTLRGERARKVNF